MDQEGEDKMKKIVKGPRKHRAGAHLGVRTQPDTVPFKQMGLNPEPLKFVISDCVQFAYANKL